MSDVTAPTSPAATRSRGTPRIWGLSPVEVHDRFWASRGVHVVRPGDGTDVTEAAELYLLVDAQTLVAFRIRELVELLSWLDPTLLLLRLRDRGHADYSEVVRIGPEGRFLGFERIYPGRGLHHARVALTPSREIARLWQREGESADGWAALRCAVPRARRAARSVVGRVFDASRAEEVMDMLGCIQERWSRPDSTIPRVRQGRGDAWVDEDAHVSPDASVVGTVWVGSGREIGADELVVGPAVLWDDPAAKSASGPVPWGELEPAAMTSGSPAPSGIAPRMSRPGKRLFDILFSAVALALTLPLYPIIALAILLEDGWPIFFSHRRESIGGREFPCLKFRSMRRDAESTKSGLQSKNIADGPQFFVEKDPRSTRVGRFLRTTQLDEIPQFLNVLAGHMSVVGPRPSPRRENQYCPAWREARLSVRPGITGLWQIRRTRAEGLDFQEWIRYDLDYVRRMGWRLDLWILRKTVGVVLARAMGK